MKKIINYFCLILVSLSIIGCSETMIEITKLSYRPVKTLIMDHEIDRKLTITIYHKNDVVYKSIIVEQFNFDEDIINTVIAYADQVEKEFQSEMFDYEGFNHSYKIENNTYISTIVLDYSKMNMEELSDRDDQYTGAAKIVNENYEVSYEKLVKMYTELGFIIE